INGAFSIAEFADTSGRCLATFIDPIGRTVSRQFTKDASEYFLSLNTSGSSADLGLSQTVRQKRQGQITLLTYTVSLNNLSPTSATDIAVLDSTPPGASIRDLTITPGNNLTSSAASSPDGLLTVNIDSLPAGNTAILSLTLTVPNGAGTLGHTVRIFASSVDPNPGNNVSTVVTTVK